MPEPKRLLYIVNDRLSALVDKGEITDRYYNPGDVFDEVHILTTTNDRVDPEAIRATAGKARLFVHRLWTGSNLVNLALTPFLRREWERRAVKLAREIQPDMVRASDRLSGTLGAAIKKALGVPLVISLHSPRDDTLEQMPWSPTRCLRLYEIGLARRAIPHADTVVIVYEPIRRYVESCGARQIEVIYNAISPSFGDAKDNYRLNSPPRILSVTRFTPRKTPYNLALAMKDIDAQLDIVGMGECKAQAMALVREHGLDDKVLFHDAIPNAAMCRQLPGYDISAIYTSHPEFPKTVLESLWLGVPTIVNNDQTRPVPEFEGDWICRAPNTPEGYAAAINRLLRDDAAREALGRRGRAYAEATFAPDAMERKLAAVHERMIST